MPHYLYIDTSERISTIFLFNETEILSIIHNENQQEHGKFIHAHIEEILEKNKITVKDLETIFVLNGPGSFTGLRISLATAKGFAYTHNIPLILLSKLDLIAYHYKDRNDDFGVAILAREDEYYFSSFSKNLDTILEPQILLKTEIENLPVYSIVSNEELHLEKRTVKVELNLKTVLNFLYTKNNSENFVKLYESTPFYLKSVHINKK